MVEMTDHTESIKSLLRRLSVKTLARTVVVSNIPRQTTQDEIHIHFQKRKSGGGDIDDIWMTKDGQAVIVFENLEVADRILERTHVLAGRKVDVRPSHAQMQCKKDYQEIVEARTFEVEPNFTKLFRRAHKEKLGQIEREYHFRIVWPENGALVEIKPTPLAEETHYQEGCDAFIDLYQTIHQSMKQQVIDVKDIRNDGKTQKATAFMRSKHPVGIERLEDQWQRSQPIGIMSWRTEKQSLPGYQDYYTIVVTYNFPSGTQGWEHPIPGHPYHGRFFTAYLPSNREGRSICELLKKAFNAQLLFTIGKCQATGEENQIICNGIKLKINRSGGAANHGYPDPTYLDRVKKNLAKIGIVEDIDSQV